MTNFKIPFQGPIDEKLVARLEDIPGHLYNMPGIRFYRNRFQVPRHFARLIPNVRDFKPSLSWDGWLRLLDRSRLWHAPFEHKDYQKTLLRFGSGPPNWSNWTKAGSGKTVVALTWLIREWYERNLRPVVVCPGGAIPTWLEEIRQCTDFEPVVLRGLRGSVRKGEMFLPDADVYPVSVPAIYIVGWESLHPGRYHAGSDFYQGWWSWIVRNLQPYSVVFDEAHHAKNPKRFRVIIEETGKKRFDPVEARSTVGMIISRHAHRRLLMTATPVANLLIDMYAQLDLMEPMLWGSKHDFGVTFCGGVHNGYGWEYKGKTNVGVLKARLALRAKAIKASIVDSELPPKRRRLVWLGSDDVGPALREAISERRRAVKEADDELALTEAALFETATRKRPWVVKDVVANLRAGQKILVFTARKADCEKLTEELKKAVTSAGLGVPVWGAHGEVSRQKRTEIRHSYMNHKGPCALVGTGHAWGEFLNLQDTDILYFVMLPYTPQHVIQWEGRVSRLGQTRPVTVVYVLLRNSADVIVHNMIIDKLPSVVEAVGDEEAGAIHSALAGTFSKSQLRAGILAFLKK